MLSLPIGSHESFILKTVHYLLQLGLVPSLSPGYVRYYLGNFDTKYIIFRKIEFSKRNFFEGKRAIFRNILFFEMKISELVKYSTNVCWSCLGIGGDGRHVLLLLLLDLLVSYWLPNARTFLDCQGHFISTASNLWGYNLQSSIFVRLCALILGICIWDNSFLFVGVTA